MAYSVCHATTPYRPLVGFVLFSPGKKGTLNDKTICQLQRDNCFRNAYQLVTLILKYVHFSRKHNKSNSYSSHFSLMLQENNSHEKISLYTKRKKKGGGGEKFLVLIFLQFSPLPPFHFKVHVLYGNQTNQKRTFHAKIANRLAIGIKRNTDNY